MSAYAVAVLARFFREYSGLALCQLGELAFIGFRAMAGNLYEKAGKMFEKTAAEAEQAERALALSYQPGPLPVFVSTDPGYSNPYSRGFRSVCMPGNNVGRELELQHLGRHVQGHVVDHRRPSQSPSLRPPPQSPAPSSAPARSVSEGTRVRSGFTLAEMENHTASQAIPADGMQGRNFAQRVDPSRWAPSRASSVYVVEDESLEDEDDSEEDDEADDTNELHVATTNHRKRPGKKKYVSQRYRQGLDTASQGSGVAVARHLGHGLVSQAASSGSLAMRAMLPPLPSMPPPPFAVGRHGTNIPPPPPTWSGSGGAGGLDHSEGDLIETKDESADPDRVVVIPAHRPRNHPVPHGGGKPVVVLNSSAAFEALSSRARDLLAAEAVPQRSVLRSRSRSPRRDGDKTAASSSGTSVHRFSDQAYAQMSRALSRVLRHDGKDGLPRVPMDDMGWARLEHAVRAAAPQIRGSGGPGGPGVKEFKEVLLHSWHPGRKAYRFEVSTIPCIGDPWGDTRTEVRALYKRSHHGGGH